MKMKKVKLEDITTLITRGVSPLYVESAGITVLNQKCIRDWRISFSESRRTSKFSEEKFLKKNDILICSTGVGTLGRVAQIGLVSETVTVDSHISIVRPDPQKCDPIFLGYFLKKSEKVIEAMAEGSTGQTELPRIKLKEFEFLIPESIEDQCKIGNMLSFLDKKIEINRKMSETLEKIGQALFKHYFIENSDAKKWMECKISDFATQIRTIEQPQKYPEKLYTHYSIPAFDKLLSPELVLGSEIKSNKYVVREGSILVSKLNPGTPRIWPIITVGDNPVCSTEFQVILPKKNYSFLYYLFTSQVYSSAMTAAAGGTSNSHKRVSPDYILAFQFKKPTIHLLEEFEKITYQNLERISDNISENKILSELRNVLLICLVSGKIQI